MNAEENKAIVTSYLQAVFDKNDLATAAGLLAENYLCYEPGREAPGDRAGTIEELKAYRAAFPDEQLRNSELSAEGDRVVVRTRFEATHRGDFYGMPASGNRISAPFTIRFRLANGKIVEERDEYDPQEFMRQLGAPTPSTTQREG
jgi:steroid delta-isomerase-like uncharacterized protein